ncbi:MFS transporter [Actinomadura madurae]|nr:MFS transporter [Actinomadura madurae]MCP9982921.1 MFS transporter [Actinomadura madurae]
MATGKEGPGTVHRAVLPAVMLSLATVVSAVASLNTAVPSIARDTHAGLTELAWIIDAYALVFAALLLLGGAIGDRYGRRRALAAGLVVFGAGSAAAALASDPDWLIAMRGVLGAGAALVMPATLSTITSTFPAEQRTRAVGAWAGVAGASGIFGLLVSGSLLEAWSWRSVFWMNVVLAVVALVATLAVVPESAEPDAPRLDLTGAVITVAGLGAGVYSIIEAPVEGWGSPRTLLGLAAAVVILAGFVLWELRRPNPLLDPRLFRIRAFSAGALTITLQFFAFFGFVFIVLQYLQLVKGDSALVGGAQPAAHGADDDALRPGRRAAARRPARPAPRRHGRAAPRRPRDADLLPAGRGQHLLAAAGGTRPVRRRHGARHDPVHRVHHRRAARGEAGRGLGDERPRPGAGRRARHRRPRQHPAVRLPREPERGLPAGAGRRAGRVVPGGRDADRPAGRRPGAGGLRRRRPVGVPHRVDRARRHRGHRRGAVPRAPARGGRSGRRGGWAECRAPGRWTTRRAVREQPLS